MTSQNEFRPYKSRKIDFLETQSVGDWKVKTYTITSRGQFESTPQLEMAKKELPDMLSIAEQHHGYAFLIVHEATDGLWILLNWWTGKEMLRTLTYHIGPGSSNMVALPPAGSMACVWEMKVICFERELWLEKILLNHTNPDFESYARTGLSAMI